MIICSLVYEVGVNDVTFHHPFALFFLLIPLFEAITIGGKKTALGRPHTGMRQGM
jgi:hypothetical protein